MKNLITILFLINFTNLYSQEFDISEWCPNGATWVYWTNGTPFSENEHFIMYQYEKDTVAYNMNLKKINRFHFKVFTPPVGNKYRLPNTKVSSYLFYKSNDSVFYINSSENLEFLYTFSENLGTSWIIQSTTNSFVIPDEYPMDCDSLVNFQDQATINSLASVTRNDIIYTYTELTSSFMEWEYGAIYKNIGPSKSFFATPQYTPTEICSEIPDFFGYFKEVSLASYYDDIRGYNFNPNKEYAHFITTPIETLSNDDNFVIYPNPTSSLIYINETKEISTVSILNSEGKIVNEIKDGFNIISFENYERGVYYLIVKLKNKNLIRKIIKL